MTKMVLMATAFSKNSMMGMVIVALVCMGIPFIALAYMKTKTGAKITSFLKGLLFYALFAFGVSGLINILLLGGLSLSSVLNRSIHPVYYAVYGAVLAGIVEETGKFIGLKYMMKKNPDKQNALLFGLGHGGLEALAYGSSLFMGNFVLALLVNSLGVDEYFNKLGITGEKLVEQKNNLAALMAIPTSEYVAYGIERATVNKRTKLQAFANIQETDSFWSVEFMSAGTQHIDMKFIDVDRNLTKRLNRIGME